MSRAVEHIALNPMSPGTSQHLTVFRYGKFGARPKAYIQGAIHADEPPGILILHHLCRLLDAADLRGEILGEIVVVPSANPIGLDQVINTTRAGRHEFRSGTNFNRAFPDLSADLIARVKDRLTGNPADNVTLVRAELKNIQSERRPLTALGQMQLELQKLAIDADMVIDLSDGHARAGGGSEAACRRYGYQLALRVGAFHQQLLFR
jgi:predicted deacylase